MANRPPIGTGISNINMCDDCSGTFCFEGDCWHRTHNLGGDQCKCFPDPGPTAGDGQPGTYPGWSGWSRKPSTQSTNTISISTTDGEMQVEVQRIAEIRYVDENDNVNSIPFPGYLKAQEITNYVMDVNNIEAPPRIGLTPSSPPVARSAKPTKDDNNDNCKCNGVKGCCGTDECYSMNGYEGPTGPEHKCWSIGIKWWPNPTMNLFDKPLRSTTKSGLSYRTIIGAYACGTQEAQACNNVCGYFEMGCCLPSGTDPCPKWNSKLSTCYHIGLWSADNVLIGKTYVCASSPAEALYIDCPTCSTGGGGSTTTTPIGVRQCIQKIDPTNGKIIKACAPLPNTGKQGQQ